MIADMPRTRPRPTSTARPLAAGKLSGSCGSEKVPGRGSAGTTDRQNSARRIRAAISGSPTSGPAKAAKSSLAWLVAQYRESGAWLNGLSQATKRQRENIFKGVLTTAGADAANVITRKHIVAGLERRAKTPSQARNFLDAMRGLFEWAKEAEHVRMDPTAAVKSPPRAENSRLPGLD